MRVILETEDEGPLAEALLSAVRHSGANVAVGDPIWTPERAEQFVQEVSPKGRRLLRAAAEGNGRVDGEKFRAQYGEDALHGPSAAITKAVTRGIRDGWLPEGAELPLNSTYDGRGSWSKTDGYRMPQHLAGIFREAFARVYPTSAEVPEDALKHLAEIYEMAGREPDYARERAEAFFEEHADALTAWGVARNAARTNA
jgi:hypothetical protein